MVKPKKHVTTQTIQEPKEDKKITEGQVSVQSNEIAFRPNEAIKKLKPNGLTVEQIDQKYYNLLDEHEILKRDIISSYAKELETQGKMPTDEVCKHVIEKLDGICSADYVRECLDSRFKNKAMAKNASARKDNPASTKKQTMEEPEPESTEDEEDEPEPDTIESAPVIDKFKAFQETIAAKNKLLKQKDEEIAGLTKQNKKLLEQLNYANKKIASLEKELDKMKK